MEFTLEAMHAIEQNAALDGDAIDAPTSARCIRSA